MKNRSLTTARSLPEKFNVSTRTIYRDIRTSEQAGIPNREGKGCTLMEC